MKKSFYKKTAVFAVAMFLAFSFPAFAAIANNPQPQKYDGVITQLNAGDGSFTLRLRNGQIITVPNPLSPQLFISIQGILDPVKWTLDKVTSITVKSASSSDAIPQISGFDPGSLQWGTKVTLSGSGFTKSGNSISIGNYKNAITNIPAAGGKLTFSLPAKLCDKKIKTNCSPSKFYLPAGQYDLVLSNGNGVSNSISFGVNPLPALSITNDSLPQVVGGTRYTVPLTGTGGAEDYIWRIPAGSLPLGLNLIQASCPDAPCRAVAAITGIPTKPGVYGFTISLTSGSEIVARDLSITVVQPLMNILNP